MPIDLPADVSRSLREFEAAAGPLNTIELAAQLDAAVGPLDALSEDQKRACLAEMGFEVQWNGYAQLNIIVLMESILLCGVN